MNIKTITTTDGVNTVDFGSAASRFYWFRNIGTTTVYVSGNSDISAGGDGVAELPSGGSVCIETLGGKVYILGEGKVQIHNTGDKFCPFHNAPVSGDGGKTVTVSNPNLLINPDFTINQRGNTGITISSSTWVNFFIADRWKLYINNASPSGAIQRNDDGTITLSMTAGYCDIRQMFETPLEEGYYTLSAKINGEVIILSGYKYNDKELIGNGLVLGNNFFGIRCHEQKVIAVEWAKLEYGSVNTPFVTPNISDEITKCLRYYETITFGTTAGLPAVMWKNDTNVCHTNIPIFEKRNTASINPTVTISGDTKRFVSNLGLFNISGYSITSYAPNNLGIQFTLSSAPSAPAFGWVDKFVVSIDAEL